LRAGGPQSTPRARWKTAPGLAARFQRQPPGSIASGAAGSDQAPRRRSSRPVAGRHTAICILGFTTIAVAPFPARGLPSRRGRYLHYAGSGALRWKVSPALASPGGRVRSNQAHDASRHVREPHRSPEWLGRAPGPAIPPRQAGTRTTRWPRSRRDPRHLPSRSWEVAAELRGPGTRSPWSPGQLGRLAPAVRRVKARLACGGRPTGGMRALIGGPEPHRHLLIVDVFHERDRFLGPRPPAHRARSACPLDQRPIVAATIRRADRALRSSDPSPVIARRCQAVMRAPSLSSRRSYRPGQWCLFRPFCGSWPGSRSAR
jgi:hypothetical protein